MSPAPIKRIRASATSATNERLAQPVALAARHPPIALFESAVQLGGRILPRGSQTGEHSGSDGQDESEEKRPYVQMKRFQVADPVQLGRHRGSQQVYTPDREQ